MVNKLLTSDIDEADFVDIPGEAEDISDMQRDIDGQMNRIFMEFGGDDRDTEFKINVKRVIPGKGELEHCFSALPNELPIMDKITEHYGPGEYEIWIYRNGKIFKRRKLTIAKPLKKIETRPQNGTSELSGILSAMAENNRQHMEQLRELLLMRNNFSQPQQSNITEMMTGIAAMMGAFRDFMPQQNGGGNMDMFIKGIELAKDFASESGGAEKGFADVLITAAKEFGGPLLEMSKNRMAMGQVQLPQHAGVHFKQLPPGEAIQPPMQPQMQTVHQTAAPIAPQNQEREIMNALSFQLAMLVNKAKNNADPALYADLIIDNMPEEQIREFITRADMFEFLGGINGGVLHHRKWFEQLKAEIESILTDTPEGEDNTDETHGESVTNARQDDPNGDTPSNT